MNDGLIDGFRHNTWATRQLLNACQGLSDEQLQATVPGVYGNIIDTLRHLVNSESGYYARLSGEEPSWDRRAGGQPTVAELQKRVDELEARWERYLSKPFDAEQTFVITWIDGIDRDVPAGVILMQALHHGNEHRSQVATILTTIGVTPPGWGLWEYAEATDRAPQRVT